MASNSFFFSLNIIKEKYMGIKARYDALDRVYIRVVNAVIINGSFVKKLKRVSSGAKVYVNTMS